MTSTTANNNSTSSSQPAQFSFNGSKPGSTSPLASLANATEPSNFSFNQQQTSVAIFPQRGSATVCFLLCLYSSQKKNLIFPE
jgi:hypothetical protein